MTKQSDVSFSEPNFLLGNVKNQSQSSESKGAKELPKFSFGSKVETSSVDKKEIETPCRPSSKSDKKEESETIPLSALFKKQEKTWDCPVCMVNNADDLLSCQSCGEAKPGTSKESSGFNPNTSIKFSSFLTDDKQASKAEDKPQVILNQGGGFSLPTLKPEQKKEEKIVEEKKVEKVENKTPNEKSANSSVSGENSLAAMFKKSDVWRCPSCDVENKNDIELCVCCGDSKPGTKKADTTLKSDSGLKFSFVDSSNKAVKSVNSSSLVLNETGGFKLSAPLTSTSTKETPKQSVTTSKFFHHQRV